MLLHCIDEYSKLVFMRLLHLIKLSPRPRKFEALSINFQDIESKAFSKSFNTNNHTLI